MSDRLVTIRRFSLPWQADLACATLEAKGIPAFVLDANTVAMNWLWSNAIGGVQLQVPESCVEEAIEALVSVTSKNMYISRTQKVSAIWVGPSGKDTEFHDFEYRIHISVSDFISPEEFHEVNRRNEELKKECSRLYAEKFHKIPKRKDKTPFWGYTYYPRNEEEEAFVRKVKAIRRMPQYHYKGRAYSIEAYNIYFKFKKTEEREECQKTTKNIKSLFIPYEAREGHRTRQ
jgi:hypothetical protein